jgi:hypothetical protein
VCSPLYDWVNSLAEWLGTYSARRQGGKVDGAAVADLCALFHHVSPSADGHEAGHIEARMALGDMTS